MPRASICPRREPKQAQGTVKPPAPPGAEFLQIPRNLAAPLPRRAVHGYKPGMTLHALNRAPAITAAALLVAGVLIFRYTTGMVRNWLGDVIVVVFLVAIPAAIRLGTARQRLIGVGLLSAGIEAFQGLGLIPPDAHWLWRITVGTTYDPWDLAAYLLGIGVAALAERRWAATAPEAAP